MWISCLFAALSGSVGAEELSHLPTAAQSPYPIEGDEKQATSANFHVYSQAIDSREIATLCEDQRSTLLKMWSPDCELPPWMPQCNVVVHATRASFASSVGCTSQTTVGSTWIGVEDGRITKRRIDLIEDGRQLPALGHELTHAVMADVFGGLRPPPWADEGMAVLSDSLGKRRLHERDLERAMFQRAMWPLPTLLSRECHPNAVNFPTFYAQSASLTAFLVKRVSPSQFVRFVKSARTNGYDRALNEEYSIADVAQLERLWRPQATRQLTARDEQTCRGK
jgi:hypothetical protein